MGKNTVTITKEEYDELVSTKKVLEEFVKTSEDNCRECRHKNRSYYDNMPLPLIDQYVKEDLEVYDQDNSSPMSLTKIFYNGKYKMFRHYELGPIMGYVVYGFIPQEGDTQTIHAMISCVEEDDENWFAPITPMNMSSAWMRGTIKTLQRMEKWCGDHFFEGFVDGNWVSKITKEICNEVIYQDDGSSSCPVLGGHDNE